MAPAASPSAPECGTTATALRRAILALARWASASTSASTSKYSPESGVRTPVQPGSRARHAVGLRGEGHGRRPAVPRHAPLAVRAAPAGLARAPGGGPALLRLARHPDVPDADRPRALRVAPRAHAIPLPA